MRLVILLILCQLVSNSSFGQKIWSDVAWEDKEAELNNYRSIKIENSTLKQLLNTPLTKDDLLLSLPLPDGNEVEVQAKVQSSFHPDLASKYPNIRSYKGIEKSSGKLITHFTITSKGLHAAIITDKGYAFIQPASMEEHYVVYYNSNISHNPSISFECGVEDLLHPAKKSNEPIKNKSKRIDPKVSRTYRLAMACTGEYAQRVGGTVESVLENIAVVIDQTNLVFNTELGVRFSVVPETENLIFLDGDSDPYIESNNSITIVNNNINVFPRFIDNSAYDIGHTLADCLGRGGVLGTARIGSLCRTSDKMVGASCFSSSNLTSNILRIFAHELGHQFNANHSWNNCQASIGQLSFSTAFEPGAGTTIMSYSGGCPGQNLQSTSDPYFHVGSLEEMLPYMESGERASCGIIENTNNEPPIVRLPYNNNFFIPISTPFELTAIAEDINGDNLTYCWEQYDLDPSTTELGSPVGNEPTFRSILPNALPTRVFPKMTNIINNVADNTEVLPTYSRDLTFRCTVRDNNEEAGAVVWEEVKFKSDETAGPFLVTRPNGMVNAWEAGGYYAVQWDVANTNNTTVNCQRVNIKLSLDGGNTFPITLLENTLNDGEENVTIPDTVSTRARIIVEAADNIFFDISNDDFNITSPTEPTLAIQTTPFYQEVCLPNTVDIQISTTGLAGFNEPVNLALVNLPAGVTASFEPATVEPGQSSNLTLELAEAGVAGLQNLELVATTASDTLVRPLEIELVSNDFSAFALNQPLDNTRDIFGITTFSWAEVPNADSYDFELADSPAFGSRTLFTATDIAIDSIRPDIFLEDNTIYFWRVRPKNQCGASAYTIPRAFQTINVQCQSFEQDTPIRISGSGTPTVESIIEIEEAGTITDLNIPIVIGSYQPVRFVEISLISPAGTQAILFDNLCGSTTEFNLSFDDEAPDAITCPPTAGIVQRPLESLSIFDGESIQGEWKMRFRVKEAGFGAGGDIERWGLESCGSIAISAPFLVTNDTLFTPPASRSQIWIETLQADDEDNSNDEIIYELVATPNNGLLYLDNQVLAAGDVFTQQDIDGFRVAYEHDGSESTNDQFYFIIRDTDGGWLGTTAFNIEINSDATVNTNDPQLAAQINLYPNPTSTVVNVDLGELTDKVRQIQLFNLNGQLIKSIQTIEKINQIEVNNLSSGLYILQVHTQLGSYNQKFVVE